MRTNSLAFFCLLLTACSSLEQPIVVQQQSGLCRLSDQHKIDEIEFQCDGDLRTFPATAVANSACLGNKTLMFKEGLDDETVVQGIALACKALAADMDQIRQSDGSSLPVQVVDRYPAAVEYVLIARRADTGAVEAVAKLGDEALTFFYRSEQLLANYTVF